MYSESWSILAIHFLLKLNHTNLHSYSPVQLWKSVRLKYYSTYWSLCPTPQWSFLEQWQQRCFMTVVVADIVGSFVIWLLGEIYCSYFYSTKREAFAAGKALQRLVTWISRRNPSWQKPGQWVSHSSSTGIAGLNSPLSWSLEANSWLRHIFMGKLTHVPRSISLPQ